MSSYSTITTTNAGTGTIESFLTRQLEIRFIDARSLVTNAKLNLDLVGYLQDDDRSTRNAVIAESIRLFHEEKTSQERRAMKSLHTKLTTVKRNSSSLSSCGSDDEDTMSTHTGFWSDADGSSMEMTSSPTSSTSTPTMHARKTRRGRIQEHRRAMKNILSSICR